MVWRRLRCSRRLDAFCKTTGRPAQPQARTYSAHPGVLRNTTGVSCIPRARHAPSTPFCAPRTSLIDEGRCYHLRRIREDYNSAYTIGHRHSDHDNFLRDYKRTRSFHIPCRLQRCVPTASSDTKSGTCYSVHYQRPQQRLERRWAVDASSRHLLRVLD